MNIRIRHEGLASLICAHGIDAQTAVKAIVGGDDEFCFIDSNDPLLHQISGYSLLGSDECVSQALRHLAEGIRRRGSVTGFGDRVALILDAMGITKERVQAVASAVGITDCGCHNRQAALNAFGEKYLGLPQRGGDESKNSS